MEILFALLPIITLLLLMVVFKKSALVSMPIAFVVGVLTSKFVWQMPANIMQASILKGIFVAIDIILIVFGALVLLELLKKTNASEEIKKTMQGITTDKRILVIIIAWSFGVFIEGAAGFGTPAALAAPLLVSLGISPLAAVIVSLISDSVPVSFGAIGTPVTKGLAQTIGDTSLIPEITFYTALIHLIIGTFVPLLVACISTKLGKEKSFRAGLKVWKFAILAGLSFTVPYFLLAKYLGPEFPSFLGGLIGLVITISVARAGIFIPDRKKTDKKVEFKLKPFVAYIVAAVLLVLTRLSFMKPIVSKAGISITDILGSGASHTFNLLTNPGILFLIAGFIAILIWKKEPKLFVEQAKAMLPRTGKVFIVLAFTTSLVQFYLMSKTNMANLGSMPSVVAMGLASLVGNAYPIFAPMIGTLGAFITGSNTVSNMLFAAFQEQSAMNLGISSAIILALQNVGGAIGNMIAPHNIIAASATVKLKNQESKVLRTTIIPAFIYALLAGLVGLVLIFVL